MDSKAQTSLSENKYIRVTVIIAYLKKETCEHDYSYTHLDDYYPDLINTHNLINKLHSNETYQILGIEYEWECVPFSSIDTTLVNTIH